MTRDGDQLSRASEFTDLSPHVQVLNGLGLSSPAPEKQIAPKNEKNIVDDVKRRVVLRGFLGC